MRAAHRHDAVAHQRPAHVNDEDQTERTIPVSNPLSATDRVIVVTAPMIARFFHAVRLCLLSRRNSVSRSSRKLQRIEAAEADGKQNGAQHRQGIPASTAGIRMPSANSTAAVVSPEGACVRPRGSC